MKNKACSKKNIRGLRRRAQNIRLLATDLDGTLFDRKHALSDENRAALSALAAKGVILVAATGRARASIPEMVRGLPGLKYIIAANGSKIHLNATDEVIFEKYLAPEAVDYIGPLLSDKDVLSEAFWDGAAHVEQGRYDGAPGYGIPYWFSEYFFSTRRPVADFEAAVTSQKNKIENINFVFPNDEVKRRIDSFLSPRTDLYELTSSLSFNFEIGGVGVSKAVALGFIAKLECIGLSEIIGIGDNDNDVSMIECAGIGIAVSNATPRALAAADFVTDDNQSSGVAAALKTLKLI